MAGKEFRNDEQNITDVDADCLINKLYRFLGIHNIEKALKRHENAIRLSGPLITEYTLKKRHPWFNALREIAILKSKAKSIRNHLTPEIKMLVGDAKKVSTLSKYMPFPVKEKYKRDLLDPKRAFDYLFEIKMAWHFYLKGHEIKWYEDDGVKRPEFLVATEDFEFNVECKRISADTSRKVKREDFHRFSDDLLSNIQSKGYAGSVDILLDERFEGNQIKSLVTEILERIDSGGIKNQFAISLGNIKLDLDAKSKRSVSINELEKKVSDGLASGKYTAFTFTGRNSNDIIDPLLVSVESKKPDKVLDGIYDKIYNAADGQLCKSMPGIVICFLEDVYDLKKLGSNSGLQVMTNAILSKEKFSHLIGVGYSAETRINRVPGVEIYDNEALLFRNPNCKFETAKSYIHMSN
ncbi:MAG: hypothetical protein FVQ82_09625 [Planctomycetes bacterium]|nr:hypothetical protein [Planctomycetota bacterium]